MESRYQQLFLNKFSDLNSSIVIPKEIFDRHLVVIDMAPITETEDKKLYRAERNGFKIPLGAIYAKNIISMHVLMMHMDKEPEVKKEMLENHRFLLMNAIKDFFLYTNKGKDKATLIDENQFFKHIEEMIEKSIACFDQDKYEEWLLTYATVNLVEVRAPLSTLEKTIEFFNKEINFLDLNDQDEVVDRSLHLIDFRNAAKHICMLALQKREDGSFQVNMLSRIRNAAFSNLKNLNLSEASSNIMDLRLKAIWNNLSIEQFERFTKKSQSKISEIFIGLANAFVVWSLASLVYLFAGFSPIFYLAAGILLPFSLCLIYSGILKGHYQRIIDDVDSQKTISYQAMLQMLYEEYIPSPKTVEMVLKDDSKVSLLTYVLRNETITPSVEPQAESTASIRHRLKPEKIGSLSKKEQIREANRAGEKEPEEVITWKNKKTGNPYTPPATVYPIRSAYQKYGFITDQAFNELTQDLPKRENRANFFNQVVFGKIGENGAKIRVNGRGGKGNRSANGNPVAIGPKGQELWGFDQTDLNRHKTYSRK